MTGDAANQPQGQVAPTLGRIVWYCEPAAKPGDVAVDRAAIVLAAGDGDNVDLWVFTPSGGYYKAAVRHVERAPEDQPKMYAWRWSERVG